MTKAVEEWTDARLNDLAAALAPVPTQLAMLNVSVSQFEHVAGRSEPLPAKLAVLTASVERVTDDNRALRRRTRRDPAPAPLDLLGTHSGACRCRRRADRRSDLSQDTNATGRAPPPLNHGHPSIPQWIWSQWSAPAKPAIAATNNGASRQAWARRRETWTDHGRWRRTGVAEKVAPQAPRGDRASPSRVASCADEPSTTRRWPFSGHSAHDRGASRSEAIATSTRPSPDHSAHPQTPPKSSPPQTSPPIPFDRGRPDHQAPARPREASTLREPDTSAISS